MANPSYYQTSPPVSSQVQHQEHHFHLYAHQQAQTNQRNILASERPHNFGCTLVVDWGIRDGDDTTKANVVARLQGLAMAAGKNEEKWYTAFNMSFKDDSFKGSTLSMQGPLGPPVKSEKGEWAVVGGTGKFVYAQGIVNYKIIEVLKYETITELRIHIVCLTFPKPNPVQKVGPWGGEEGTAYKIQETELPQRLQSITIYSGDDVIKSIAFSYIDQAAQNRIVDPWGGDINENFKPQVIELGSSETVKEIFGTTGIRTTYSRHTIVTSLGIVTDNNKTYRYGEQSLDNIYFKEAAPDNQNIVGFYGRVGDVVHQIGAYVA